MGGIKTFAKRQLHDSQTYRHRQVKGMKEEPASPQGECQGPQYRRLPQSDTIMFKFVFLFFWINKNQI